MGNKLTPEEEFEKQQNDSTDIYKVAARVKNLARSVPSVNGRSSADLTPAGEALCNLYAHVLKSLYDFSETLESPKKEELYDILRKHEEMPRTLISAMKPSKKQ